MAPEDVNEPKPDLVEASLRQLLVPGRQPGQRVGIFVDIQNMFFSAKHLYQSKVNYRRLQEDLTAGRRLVRAIAYVVTKPEVDQSGFTDALTRLGYEIRLKYMKIKPDGTAKGDWAMEMSQDVMAIATKLDVVVLVTGAGDYVPLVQRLKVLGCRAEVACFPQNSSADLMSSADACIVLNESVLFKERKFEAEAAARPTDSVGNFVPRKRVVDSVAGRFAAGSNGASEGIWANDAAGQGGGTPQIDDVTAERLATQLWDREHNGQ
ncbi:MAG TPA: NYN domain-containing protein [Phycisphaerae bacterium]|nr:NYN domain-containing protein [Phycisphaerae bacterium]